MMDHYIMLSMFLDMRTRYAQGFSIYILSVLKHIWGAETCLSYWRILLGRAEWRRNNAPIGVLLAHGC
ncbi:MAG: hypothetical protein XD36_1851 [Halomonas sp. 54_146]|nr:MAG: hypothetical protein XD36_1851 [Halomonas sp. 54_146]